MVFDRIAGVFGRFPDSSPDLAKALVDLDRLIASRPELEPAGRSLAEVLKAAFLEPAASNSGSVDGVIQLFRSVMPMIDEKRLRRRIDAIVHAISPRSPALDKLQVALKRRSINPVEWSYDILTGRTETIEPVIDKLGLDAELVGSVLRYGLLPELACFSGITEQTSENCPWCGSFPMFAELRGLERSVRLRCGLCAGDWAGGRTRCSACGETDHRRLAFFHAEGEADRYRLLICETCGERLKFVATLSRLSAPSLIVADFASIHLDLVESSQLIISLPLSAES